MGNSRMNSQDWASYNSTHTAGKSRAQVFGSTSMKDAYNPALISVRESRDSAANPNSSPILLGCDVTGSMGMIAEQLMRTDLIKIAEGIYDRKPMPDPHIAVLAIGDAFSDRAPLQATQFEASITLADQMRELWLEGNGGGNGGESYSLAHLFAATKTVSDGWEVRRNKGVLITIGDEPIHDRIEGDDLARIMGAQFSQTMTKRQCVDLASQTYEVFHIVLANEGYASHGLRHVLETWNEIMPQRVIQLTDVTKLSETIVSVLQVINGERKEDVAASWGSGSSMVVYDAIKDLQVAKRNKGVSRLA
ncbi:hypothetical protein HFN89_02650 [Rhizobium laguerreae]|nr:hypothetical protein [Rhizobium laguerreae]